MCKEYDGAEWHFTIRERIQSEIETLQGKARKFKNLYYNATMHNADRDEYKKIWEESIFCLRTLQELIINA